MKITSEKIRQILPSRKIRTIIIASEGYSLECVISFKGDMDETFSVTSFIIYTDKGFHSCYNDLQSALNQWGKIV